MASKIDEKNDVEAARSRTRSLSVVGEIKDLQHADAALEFLRKDGEVLVPMTAADEKLVKHKVDWRIVPLMLACYMLQYLDKTLINYANVMGLQKETNITGDQFSQLAMIFYVSYLAFEFPQGWALQRFPTGKYLGLMVVCWGTVLTCTAACSDWAGLVTTRVLLGVFEAVIAPSLILITSMWYKKNEQAPRTGLWYCGTGSGVILGSLMSYGFQHYKGSTFSSWQIMFLLCGLVTIVVGIVVIFFMPDNPMTAKFLTHQEKVWAIERLRENQTGIENKQFKWRQALECFTDPQTWLLSSIVVASMVPNGAISSFQATIIKGFGYTSKQTALLQIPSGVVSIVSIVGATTMAGKYNHRCFNIIALITAGMVGGCLMAFLPEENKTGKLIGNYLTQCVGSALPLMYSIAGANYAGHTKKVTMNATLLIAFCLGNIIGPLTFTAASAPEYIPAKIAIIVTCALTNCLTLALYFYYIWENKRRDKLIANGILDHIADIEFSDRTDRENLEFRYSL